jgi:hypothetical protein
LQKEKVGLPILHLDSGGFSSSKKNSNPITAEAIFASYEMMDVKAVNVAAKDLLSNGDYLLANRDKFKFPLLSANIVYEDSRMPVFEPYLLTEIAGMKVGIIGVTQVMASSYTSSEERKIIFEDPMPALAKAYEKLVKEADFVIVLGYLQYPRLRGTYLEQMPKVQMVAGSDGYSVSWTKNREPGTAFSYPGNEGKNVIVNEIWASKLRLKKREQKVIKLQNSWPEEESIVPIVDAAKVKLSALQRQGDQLLFDLRQQANQEYSGYMSCRECHAGQYRKWQTSKHYTAFNPLISQRKAQDPECLPCHTTGYEEGAFIDVRVTPGMVNVQCEACHGAGDKHVANPKVAMPQKTPSAECRKCHDEKNSPEFVYSDYWKKIQH